MGDQRQGPQPATAFPGLGLDPSALSDEDLFRELESLQRTREDALRHGSTDALRNHTRRTAELEVEYLRRFPGREIDPGRLRPPDPSPDTASS